MKYKFLKTKAIIEIFLIVTVTIFISLSLSSKDVSAGCCKDSGTGQTCFDATSNTGCANYVDASCNDDADCSVVGCCGNGEGQCSNGVSKLECELHNNKFGVGLCSEGPNAATICGGCCVIGKMAFLTSEEICKDVFGGDYNGEINSFDKCTKEASTSEEGCCVSGKDFKYTFRGLCAGTFFKNILCKDVTGYADAGYTTHSKYECGPAGTTKQTDVYYYDSAGNLEDIKEKCNVNDMSLPTSACDNKKGDYSCESLDCASTWDNPVVDENGDGILNNDGESRKNGESWCEYQAAVGPGMDLPGTRHYVHKCTDGKEIVAEQCAEDRNTICIQSEVDYGNAKLSTASCVANSGASCLNFGDQATCQDSANGNCIWINDRCVPLVPPGSSDSCIIGSLVVQTAWAQKCKGNWRCNGIDGNCLAYGNDFLKSANTLCNVYGDCGAKYNLAQQYTNGGLYRTCPDVPNIKGAILKNNPEGTGGWCLHYLPAWTSFSNFANAGRGLFLGTIKAEDLKDSSGTNYASFGTGTLGLVSLSINYLSSEAQQNKLSGIYNIMTEGLKIAQTLMPFAMGSIAFGPHAAIIAFGIEAGIIIGSLLWTFELEGIPALFKGEFKEFWSNFETAFGEAFKCGKNEIRDDPQTTCSAWQPPKGGADCWKCNEKKSSGGLLPDEKFEIGENEIGEISPYNCYETLCTSLGTQCQFKPDEPTGPRCIVDKGDINQPLINIDYENTKYYCNLPESGGGAGPGEGEGCSENPQSGITIISEGGLEKGFTINGLLVDLYEGAISVPPKLPINISISTNKDAVCRYNHVGENVIDSAKADSEYKEMNKMFAQPGFETGHTTIHTLSLRGNLLVSGEHTLYVRCEGWNQIPNSFSYVIKYNVAKQPDFSPLIIEEFIPANNGYVKYGETKQTVTLRINEPINIITESDLSSTTETESSTDEPSDEATRPGCKWSKTSSKTYDEMENRLTCSSDTLKCSGELDIIPGENKFYFKCKDSAGNANDQDREYILKSSTTELKIGEISCEHDLPDGSISNDCANVYARNFTSIFSTEGGAGGDAECSYSGLGSSTLFETGGTLHKQHFGGDGSLSQGFNTGSYSFNFKCEDIAGNTAEKTLGVEIKVDNNEPEIIKVYSDGSFLNIITDEYATCYYTNTKDFEYETAQTMSPSADHLKHSASAKSYYKIGCADRFGNYMTPISIHL